MPRCSCARGVEARRRAVEASFPEAALKGRPIGHDQGMSSAAEISSLSSSLEELTRRVTAMAEGALNEGDEDMAHELIAVERALGGALRRLQR